MREGHAMSSIADLESLLLECRTERARSYLSEAIACYHSGAYRAAIVMTWITLVFDVIDKLRDLALGGDPNASRIVENLESVAQTHDLKKALVFERSLLDMASKEFELFGEIEHQELTRLLEDRHRCAHPSMFSASEDFKPTAEMARYHIRNAVTYLLRYPAAQGKAALSRLVGDLERQTYPDNLEALIIHLKSGPLGNPRASLLRNFIAALLKDLYLGQAGLTSDSLLLPSRQRREDRIIMTLSAIVRLHRADGVAMITEHLASMSAAAPDEKLRLTIAILGAMPQVWPVLGQSLQGRLFRYVETVPQEQLGEVMLAGWAVTDLRPGVESRLRSMSPYHWSLLGPHPLPAEWMSIAWEALRRANSFDSANRMINSVLAPVVQQMTLDELRALLDIAAGNSEVAESFALSDLLRRLATRLGVQALLGEVERRNLRSSFPWLEDERMEG
jgi:hypothetical protein